MVDFDAGVGSMNPADILAGPGSEYFTAEDVDRLTKSPCPICGKLFYPGGMGTHLATHGTIRRLNVTTAEDREAAVVIIKRAIDCMANRGIKAPLVDIAGHAMDRLRGA